MPPKEFRFKGKSSQELQELSIDEVALMLPSKERRKIKRGFSDEEKNLLQKLSKRDKVKTHQREMLVLPSMFNKTIMVHNGKEYVQVVVQPEMIGKKLGTFALTRKMVRHSSGGITKGKDDKK